MTSQPFSVFDLDSQNRQAFADITVTMVKIPCQDSYQVILALALRWASSLYNRSFFQYIIPTLKLIPSKSGPSNESVVRT